MDTSREYREMCAKAKEIQDDWIEEIGDLFITPDDFSMVVEKNYSYIFLEFLDNKGLSDDDYYHIWLPRQDQLQDMIMKVSDYESIATLLTDFYRHIRGIEPFDFTSIEQLWLAFVMKEKYNKVWNGNDWVNE